MTHANRMEEMGRNIVAHRAAMDCEKNYDPDTDEEGYAISCLNALHRFTVSKGRSWDGELRLAQECFDQDEAELHEEERNKTAVYRILRDNQDEQSTRYHILSKDEVDALQTLLEDRT